IAALINEKGIGWNVPFSQNKILDVLDSLSKEEVLKKKKAIGRIRAQFSRNTLHQQILNVITS
ncbi:MAG: hypothetical protein R6U40_11880, partial [Desulfobacterales bacterium]